MLIDLHDCNRSYITLLRMLKYAGKQINNFSKIYVKIVRLYNLYVFVTKP